MCWPEHMWRTGPAFSPSRASRAAVSASSGMPLGAAGEQRLADAGPAIEALERPDVEVLARVRARHDRDLGRLEVEGLDAAGLDQREQPERLDRRAQGDDPVRVAELADDPAGDVGLDDVAAMDALLDPVADLPDEDRRAPSARATRHGRRDVPAAVRRGRLGRARSDAISVACGRLRADRDGEDTAAIATMRSAEPPSSPGGRPCPPRPPRLAASGRPAQARHPARRADRAEEVPRGRARAVVAARLRGAGRRPRPAARDPDAARADDRAASSASASGSCRSCGPGSGWSTRCSS